MSEGEDGSKSGGDKETDEARKTDGPSAGCYTISLTTLLTPVHQQTEVKC